MEDILAYIIGILIGIIIVLLIIMNANATREIENKDCIYYHKNIYCKAKGEDNVKD